MDEVGLVLVLTTFDDPQDAARVGRKLVEDRLAACATRVPGATATYWWQGQIEESSEILLLLKTTAERHDALIETLRELHPYEVPEIVSFIPTSTNKPYMRWLAESLASASPSGGGRRPGGAT